MQLKPSPKRVKFWGNPRLILALLAARTAHRALSAGIDTLWLTHVAGYFSSMGSTPIRFALAAVPPRSKPIFPGISSSANCRRRRCSPLGPKAPTLSGPARPRSDGLHLDRRCPQGKKNRHNVHRVSQRSGVVFSTGAVRSRPEGCHDDSARRRLQRMQQRDFQSALPGHERVRGRARQPVGFDAAAKESHTCENLSAIALSKFTSRGFSVRFQLTLNPTLNF